MRSISGLTTGRFLSGLLGVPIFCAAWLFGCSAEVVVDIHDEEEIEAELVFISFEFLAPGALGIAIGAVYHEQGYEFFSPGGMAALGALDPAFIGSTAIFAEDADDFIEVVRIDGGRFIPLTLDVAALELSVEGDPLPFFLELHAVDEFGHASAVVLDVDPLEIAFRRPFDVQHRGDQIVVSIDLLSLFPHPVSLSFSWRCDCQVDSLELERID